MIIIVDLWDTGLIGKGIPGAGEPGGLPLGA